MLCVFMNVLAYQCEKANKKASEFEISHLYWSFSINIMAVKVLMVWPHQ